MKSYNIRKGSSDYKTDIENALKDYYKEKVTILETSTSSRLDFKVEGVAGGKEISTAYSDIYWAIKDSETIRTLERRYNNARSLDLILDDNAIIFTISDTTTSYGGNAVNIIGETTDGKALAIGLLYVPKEGKAKIYVEGEPLISNLAIIALNQEYQNASGELLQVPLKVAGPTKIYDIKNLYSISLSSEEHQIGKDFIITSYNLDQERASKTRALPTSILYKASN